MSQLRRTLRFVFGTVTAMTLAVPGTAIARPEVFTIVQHNVTTSQSFPDDICGPRAVTETLTDRVQVTHLTANDDGSFHFVDVETGTLIADYADPAIPDQQMRRTNTEVFNLTPGGTFTHTDTISQHDATLRITAQIHLTLVDGEPKVDREVTMVRGCP